MWSPSCLKLQNGGFLGAARREGEKEGGIEGGMDGGLGRGGRKDGGQIEARMQITRKYDITEEGEEETESRPKIRDC